MGFLGPEDTVFSQLKVERDGRSNVKAQNYATSIEKVRDKYFIGNECRNLTFWQYKMFLN